MYNGHVKTVTATEFKNNALKLLEEAHQTGQTIQITKRGKPYGNLTSATEPERKPIEFGKSAHLVTFMGDVVSPIVPESDYSTWEWWS